MSTMQKNLIIDDNLNDQRFQLICAKLEELSGIQVEKRKRAMVISRLAKRSKTLGIRSLAEYCDFLLSENGKIECQSFVEALTTNMTRFNREEKQFQHLRGTVLPELDKAARNNQRVRLWSAGCSSGEEAYNIAFEALEVNPNIFRNDFRILATDIDRLILKKAESGTYHEDEINLLASGHVERYFAKSKSHDCFSSVLPDIKRNIKFAQLNLNGSWPMKGLFDVIMCRNVAIYFSEKIQTTLWQRFSNNLSIGGYLYIGHSEVVQNFDEIGLQVLGRGIYQKKLMGIH